MANINLTKLNLKVNKEVKTFEYNDSIIEVKQFIPTQTKLAVITDSINMSVEEQGFVNPVKAVIYLEINIIRQYTNIKFTDKQLEDIPKLYDLFINSELHQQILNNIPNNEKQLMLDWTFQLMEVIGNYNTSALGILTNLKNGFNNLDYDVTELQKKISDPNSIELFRQILPALGLDTQESEQ